MGGRIFWFGALFHIKRWCSDLTSWDYSNEHQSFLIVRLHPIVHLLLEEHPDYNPNLIVRWQPKVCLLLEEHPEIFLMSEKPKTCSFSQTTKLVRCHKTRNLFTVTSPETRSLSQDLKLVRCHKTRNSFVVTRPETRSLSQDPKLVHCHKTRNSFIVTRPETRLTPRKFQHVDLLPQVKRKCYARFIAYEENFAATRH